MRNAGLEEAQAGIKIAERNSNNLRYADNTTLMAESDNKAEIDVFLELSSFFHNPVDVGNLISGSSAFLKPV